ncbi:hypothetical protein TBR22_A39270 [Luteitalea sp. TBR-22]|uniref:glycosyltransferase family 2 protein n=1 Tax=Luteitalea sp. TBR-22 TaxID=2802971 RepID=UPI001AF18CC4|nr:glycosyltransferase family 2 protein [Luteitalea sp. TBR-22]BCS34701.1 hypothetical protein TBR22_A39270 [Luteitalea sp. TBR-22]
MREDVAAESPLLSICIPTYNRAECLDRLLGCLSGAVERHGTRVQVCVSDNHSPDGTAAVIRSWQQRFPLDAITQASNIGATRNVSQVVGLARGRWVLVMGDDDLVSPQGLEALLGELAVAPEGTWVLAGVADDSGHELFLGGVRPGSYDTAQARSLLRHLGLQRCGFIGMHVFPASLRPTLTGLSPEASQPWPHVALLLRHVATGGIRVCATPLVHQAGAGKVLFWRQDDWMRLILRLVDLAGAARAAEGPAGGFYDAMILGQLYAADALKGMVYWRFLEPADFRTSAVRAYAARYRLLGWRAPLVLGHALVLAAVWCTPVRVLAWIDKLRGRGDTLGRYEAERERSRGFDGVQRGL